MSFGNILSGYRFEIQVFVNMYPKLHLFSLIYLYIWFNKRPELIFLPSLSQPLVCSALTDTTLLSLFLFKNPANSFPLHLYLEPSHAPQPVPLPGLLPPKTMCPESLMYPRGRPGIEPVWESSCSTLTTALKGYCVSTVFYWHDMLCLLLVNLLHHES